MKIIFTLLLVLFFFSCEKSIFDDRRQYAGYYTFYVDWNYDLINGDHSSGSFVSKGEIEMNDGDGLVFFINQMYSFSAKVSSDRTFTYTPDYTEYASGQFEKNGKVIFTYFTGAMAGGWTLHVRGFKR